MSKKNYPLVFIVEDNKAYSKILEHHLGINNYKNIVPIVSGEECLKKLYMKPDIIIQDYKLQGISGLSVMQRIKKILPKTEFIFLSGIEDINVAIDSVKLGAFYYIVKNDQALKQLLTKLDEIKEVQNRAFQKKKKRIIVLTLTMIVLAALFFLWLF
jgi:DNA-binding NtrC family response regulator